LSLGQFLHEPAEKPYPLDNIAIGLFFATAFFATFILTGLANGVSVATLHLTTLFAFIIMILFPTVAIVARLPAQGKELFTKKTTPFRSSEGPTVVLFGIVAVFVAQFLVLKITPAYAIFSTDLGGLILGLFTPIKLFYTFMGVAEEYFFGFGVQAYTERASQSPAVGIVTRAVLFGAYHQFVYIYFSFVIVAAGLALGLIYWAYPNLSVLAAIHGSINFILS
jgi:membrane protease YdiL (CAAX protease family)